MGVNNNVTITMSKFGISRKKSGQLVVFCFRHGLAVFLQRQHDIYVCLAVVCACGSRHEQQRK